jgi:hypothetical protein
MKTSIVAGSLIAALSLVAPLHGQQVAADVVVRSGPVAGRVIIGDRYSTYRRPVAYRRAPARVIVVERVVQRRHHHARQWRRYGYRPVTLYYVDGRYYDRYVGDRRDVREIIVYERDGRFYREGDDDRDRDRDRDDRSHHIDRDGRDWDD